MTAKESGIADYLQHPRRSLGNRYRSQAEKFLKISEDSTKNLLWAEQNARQSVLHDFTNPENWRILVRIKVMIGDSEGTRATLEDLISLMGRDPELMSQLAGIDLLDSSESLLEGALKADPLDPDEWWELVRDDPVAIEEFSRRLKLLDVRDARANILYTRRLERIRSNGMEDLFIDLSRYLLAQRPNNHEAWLELGRMYERRREFDQAWFCYDQAQIHFPKSGARDMFRKRMEESVEGFGGKPWSAPVISDRIGFLNGMRGLSTPIDHESIEISESNLEAKGPFDEVSTLREEGKTAEAFFLARRMAAEGEEGANDLVREIMEELDVE